MGHRPPGTGQRGARGRRGEEDAETAGSHNEGGCGALTDVSDPEKQQVPGPGKREEIQFGV